MTDKKIIKQFKCEKLANNDYGKLCLDMNCNLHKYKKCPNNKQIEFSKLLVKRAMEKKQNNNNNNDDDYQRAINEIGNRKEN